MKAQYWVVVLLLIFTISLVWLRGDTDRVPSSRALTEFPSHIGTLEGTDIALNQATLDVLGKGFFLNRVYSHQEDGAASRESAAGSAVSLFIGYFPTQRTGQSIHSPQNCLPGAGWTFDSSGTTEIPGNGKVERVGEYVISNGIYKQEVLYWYQSHGRAIANDYAAKFYMLRDAIAYDRTDAALVRVITAIRPGETRQQAHNRAAGFAAQITPMLPDYIPN